MTQPYFNFRSKSETSRFSLYTFNWQIAQRRDENGSQTWGYCSQLMFTNLDRSTVPIAGFFLEVYPVKVGAGMSILWLASNFKFVDTESDRKFELYSHQQFQSLVEAKSFCEQQAVLLLNQF